MKREKNYKMNIGENIRKWREFKGLKQEDLAKRLDISPGALSKIENGITDTNTKMLEDIADVLEIEISELLMNPQNFFTFNNSPNSNGGTIHGPQNIYSVDKDLLDKIITLIEKISSKI